jgi:hypothetical protein
VEKAGHFLHFHKPWFSFQGENTLKNVPYKGERPTQPDPNPLKIQFGSLIAIQI